MTLVTGKKVQTVINSHHHFDHAGGLRAAVAEGAQLFTSGMAKSYLERVFANPNRIAPDRLAQSGRQPRIVGVFGTTTLRDATRPVEIHWSRPIHARPAERPAAAGAERHHVNLVQNIERLGLQPERILPLHGRVVPIGELHRQIGR